MSTPVDPEPGVAPLGTGAPPADTSGTAPATSPAPSAGDPPTRRWALILAGAGLLALAAFWTWALLFASKESVNRVGDRAWAAAAQARCRVAVDERVALTDQTVVDRSDPAQIARRASLIDVATDGLESMLDDITSPLPNDDKGQAIVPMWAEDYRTYLQDRRDYTDELRAGDLGPFRETAVGSIPISEKLTTFATDNEMPACAPPADL